MTLKLDWMRGCATALVTPFKRDGSIDGDCFTKLVERQVKNGVKLLVPCGTTGENVTLDEDELAEVIRLTVGVARRLQAHVIAGSGTNNTANAIERTRKARSISLTKSRSPTRSARARSGVHSLRRNFRFPSATASPLPPAIPAALLPVIPGEAGLHSWFNVHKSVECHDRTRDDRRT